MRSTRATARPRRAASRATAAPVMPPPMTRRSRSADGRAARAASRVSGENGAAIVGSASYRGDATLVGRAQFGERRLGLGDLVGPSLRARHLQRATREGQRLLALATRLARLGQREPRGDRVRVLRDHLPEELLAPLGVATEQAREPDEQRPLGRERVRIAGIERERPVELAHETPQREDGGDALPVEPHELTEIAEERKVGRRALVVERHRLLGEVAPAREVLRPLVARLGAATLFALDAACAGEGAGRSLGSVAGGCDYATRDECGQRRSEVDSPHHTKNVTLPTCSREVNHAGTSSVSQAPHAPLVEAEEVCDLVHHGFPDLLAKCSVRRAVSQERPGEDRDPIGKAGEVVRPPGERDALVEAIERLARRVEPEREEQSRRRLLLDHHRDVREQAGELRGDVIERLGHQPFEFGVFHIARSVTRLVARREGEPRAAVTQVVGGTCGASVGERLRQLDEALRVQRLLWTEERPSFEGRYYRLREAICNPKPVQRPHPPILIGGGGERVLLRLVARHANVWNNGGTVGEFRQKLDVLRRHCEAEGRAYAAIEKSWFGSVILDADADRAAKRLERTAA